MNLPYYTNLDGLRAMAAIGVLLANTVSLSDTGNRAWLFALIQQGNSGVSLFFVLSGFVITRILIRARTEPRYFWNFYGRRTLRLFPLYYLALTIYILYPWLLNWTDKIPSIDLTWYYFAYLQNIARTFEWNNKGPGHFWSLAVEEHFYLIWPAIVLYFGGGRHYRLIALSAWLIIASTILRWYMYSCGFEINVFTLTRLDQLAMGGILAIGEHNGVLTGAGRKVQFGTIAFIGLAGVAATSKMSELYLNVIKHFAFGLTYFGVIGYAVTSSEKSIINRFLNLTLMQLLGRISYGLYVWHVLVIRIYQHYVGAIQPVFDLTLILSFTILISLVSWHLIEKPFLGYKSFFSN